jgi:hypothetical protein
VVGRQVLSLKTGVQFPVGLRYEGQILNPETALLRHAGAVGSVPRLPLVVDPHPTVRRLVPRFDSW